MEGRLSPVFSGSELRVLGGRAGLVASIPLGSESTIACKALGRRDIDAVFIYSDQLPHAF